DWLTSVAVEVPKARHVVKVSLRIMTTSVVAAPLTASLPTPAAAPASARWSSLLTIVTKRAKPLMTATVAIALGIESLRMSQTTLREIFRASKVWYSRYSGRAT